MNLFIEVEITNFSITIRKFAKKFYKKTVNQRNEEVNAFNILNSRGSFSVLVMSHNS